MLFSIIISVTEYAAHSYANKNLDAIESQQHKIAQVSSTLEELKADIERSHDEKHFLLQTLYPVRVAMNYGYDKDVGLTIIREANKYNLKPSFIMGIIETESTWRNHGPNHASATGLMQVEYEQGTADSIARALGYSSYDLNDPVTNIKFGTYYIAKLIRTYGDVHSALTAYNRGEGGMQQYIASTGTSRSGYSRKVLSYQEHYENQ